MRQAAILRTITERLLQSTGIGSGMRVLDLGCGAGDVLMLAAELVDPSGSVVGIDRSPQVIAVARERDALGTSSSRKPRPMRSPMLSASIARSVDTSSFTNPIQRTSSALLRVSSAPEEWWLFTNSVSSEAYVVPENVIRRDSRGEGERCCPRCCPMTRRA
jgi:SAM-dependent methyltransferase